MHCTEDIMKHLSFLHQIRLQVTLGILVIFVFSIRFNLFLINGFFLCYCCDPFFLTLISYLVYIVVSFYFDTVNILSSRESSGPLSIARTLSTSMYNKQQVHKRYLGHLSSVYCVSFDRSGKYIFTVSFTFLHSCYLFLFFLSSTYSFFY